MRAGPDDRDAVRRHAWNRWRYHYPQAAFPYELLRAENGGRGKSDPEYELLDTGVFDGDRYWITEVRYAKASPTDLLMVVSVTNAGPDPDTLHVLPTAWFRNTWSWDAGVTKPVVEASGAAARLEHPFLGTLELMADAGPDGTKPAMLFCENETNTARLFGGGFDEVSAFFDLVAQDPVVSQAKLIAEPWDVGQADSYDLGRFPPLWRWPST